MDNYSVREYAQSDIPAMRALWKRVFGDSDELLDIFFALLPDFGTGCVAVREGELLGAAYCVTGMKLGDDICAYIYAVATEERSRGLGIGAALCRFAAALGRERGAKIVCTEPADQPLFGWYKKIMGLEPVLYRRCITVESDPSAMAMPMSSTEYMLWRENMLRGKKHLTLSNPALEFQLRLCKAYGGGFYACESGIGAAYVENGVGVIRELICPDEDISLCAAGISAALGVKTVRVYLPAESGEAYIAALPGSIAPGTVWNLSFD